jgi:acyl-CoA thioesterase-2
MMELEPHGPDTYLGVGPRYPWGGLYGGQIVAQGLRAAGHTVDPQYRVHSLHAYFIRLGDADQPIRFEVDRIRDGRTFRTRRVVARQSGGAIFNMSASFQVDEEGPGVQTAELGDVPPPDQLESASWSPEFDRRYIPTSEEGRARAWLKMHQEVGTDRHLHACALAFLSDDLPTDAVARLHPDRVDLGSDEFPFFSASLDHGIWFHRDLRADQWHVHDLVSHGLMSSRGLAVGQVFDSTGGHAATITQEVLLRRHRG